MATDPSQQHLVEQELALAVVDNDKKLSANDAENSDAVESEEEEEVVFVGRDPSQAKYEDVGYWDVNTESRKREKTQQIENHRRKMNAFMNKYDLEEATKTTNDEDELYEYSNLRGDRECIKIGYLAYDTMKELMELLKDPSTASNKAMNKISKNLDRLQARSGCLPLKKILAVSTSTTSTNE